MFTIKNANKQLLATYKDSHYAIGFRNQNMATHVQYNMFHHELVDPILYITKKSRYRNTYAELYIQKAKQTRECMLQIPYHLDIINHDSFMTYPINSGIGVVLPKDIIEEEDEMILMRCYIIDPIKI